MRPKKRNQVIESLSHKATHWIGTTDSIIIHTILFTGIFLLKFLKIPFDSILLVLTTAVSLEAIYLAIFIQMTVNRHTQSLEDVEEDIEEIQEDVKDLGDDLEEIQESEEEEEVQDKRTKTALNRIETDLQRLLRDIEALKKQKNSTKPL